MINMGCTARLAVKRPVCQFKMTLREVERIGLTEADYKLDRTIICRRPTAIVHDILLFSCYTGLAYADVKKLKRSEIIIGVDDEQWLVSRRQKRDISATMGSVGLQKAMWWQECPLW